MRVSKVYQPTDEEFKSLIKENTSYSECARQLGLSPIGHNCRYQIKKRADELGCDLSHFSQTAAAHQAQTKYSLEELLVKNCPYTNTTQIKKKLLELGLLKYQCACCGNTGEWNGKPLRLQMDHINGDHFDNRIENLRILCPNCHSQTETYGGKNKPYQKNNIKD